MTSWRWIPPIAPLLAAWYLALSLLHEGAGTRPWHDVSGTLVLATATALLCWWISARLLTERTNAAVLAVTLVSWFALFGTVRIFWSDSLPASWLAPSRLLVLWLAPAVLVALFFRKVRPLGSGLLRGLTAALTVLAVIPAIGLIRDWTPETVAPSKAAPVVDARRSDRPDVYLVVLDKFSSPATMQEVYGIDLQPFVDSLESLGFIVPLHARTNYIHTQLVLATLLNGRMVHEALAEQSHQPWVETERMIAQATIWERMHREGYRTAFFPTRFPGTASNDSVDIALEPAEPPISGFGQTWIINTPIEPAIRLLCRECRSLQLFPYPVQRAERLRWQLEMMATLPDSAGPLFTFLHFLGSHEPYVFDASCRPQTPWWPATEPGADSVAMRRAYGAQIECVSHLVLATVTALITTSRISPVILLQSDHGNGEIALDFVRGITRGIEELDSERVRQRVEVFAAYRFPGARSVVPDSMTPVNVLGLVRNQLFGDSISYVPDASFWSTFQDPLTLTRVVLAPRDAAAKSATTRAAPARTP